MSFLLNPFGFGGGGAAAPLAPLSYYDADFAVRPWLSQSNWPAGLYDAGANKTWLAWESSLAICAVTIAEYDHAAGTWSFAVIDTHDAIDDDHTPPALELLSDGRLVCFYGAHAGDLRWSISDQSGGEPDITNWTRQTALTALDYTYPKPVNVDTGGGGGDLYLIARDTGVSNMTLYVQKATYTSGGAVSFGAATELVDFDDGGGARVYAAEARFDGTDIEFMASRSNFTDTSRADVYYFRYVLSTGAVENLSGGTSVSSGSLPVDRTTADASFREFTTASNGTSIPSWCRDAAGDLHVAYLDDATTPNDCYHAIYDGSWSTPEMVVAIPDPSGDSDGGKSTFALVPGLSATVQLWYTPGTNGGWTAKGGDDLARRVYNGSWGSEEIIVTGDEATALGNPTAIKDGHANFRVAGTELIQTLSEGNRARLKRYGYGDGGFIQWPTFSDENLHSVILNLQGEGSNGATSDTDRSHWSHLHGVTFNGNAQISTAQAPSFATSAFKFDGTGDYLIVDYARDSSAPGHEWKFNSGTLEFFFRPEELGRSQHIFSTRFDATARGFNVLLNSSNRLQSICYTDASAEVWNITGATALSINTWYRVALIRDGSSISITLNTSTDASGSVSGAPSSGGTLAIGRDRSNSARDLNGRVSAIRWTKDVIRDMTSVPTAHYPTG